MRHILIKSLLGGIAKAGKEELECILRAVTDRYAAVYLNWEIATFSLPKSPPEAVNAAVSNLIRFLQTQYHLTNNEIDRQ